MPAITLGKERKFRLGLYGHSICTSSPDTPGSYQEILKNRHQNLNIVNIGAGQASQERILYELKKTKNLDAAIIFHSRPGSIFILNSIQDIKTSKKNLNHKIEYAWNNSRKYIEDIYLKQSSVNAYGLSSVFNNLEECQTTLENYLTYLYDPDLEKNRFEGALLAIDQYCLDSNIPHIIHVPNYTYIPKWFSFRSGIVDDKLIELSLLQGVNHNPNCLQDGINTLIADRISELLEKYINEKT
jgi:hypothetical protein